MITADDVASDVLQRGHVFFQSYSAGRPVGWSTDTRTYNLICVAVWLRQTLSAMGLDDLDRTTQESQFNRRSRSEEDLFSLGAEIVNDAALGKINRDRRPHKRWG